MNNGKYENNFFLSGSITPFKFNRHSCVRTAYANWHRAIEIALVLEGNGQVKYGGDEIPLKKDDIVVVNSEELHSFHGDSDFRFYTAIVGEDFFVQNGIDLSRYRFERIIRDEQTRNLYLELFEDVEIFRKTKDNITDALLVARLRSGLLRLLIDLCARHKEDESKVANEDTRAGKQYTKDVMDYISKNFAQLITLDELAEHIGVSKHHLTREFKKYTGQTLFHYINTVRCKHAEHLIASGISVTDAALQSGFQELAYFSRVYKKLRGKSPSDTKRVTSKKYD